tara:strand:+ start:471 stop:1631 length:1161 start_codon:yes stop_codon:yes gene_type:complete
MDTEYNFYPNEGESYTEMEDRQINWQLQEDIKEAEKIINHLDQTGSIYEIDLNESVVGSPLPPRLLDDDDDDDDDDGIDIRDLLYNPDDPNDRFIKVTPPTSRSTWTWTGIISLHRSGAQKAAKLIFNLIDFTYLINMLNQAGYTDVRYHQQLIAIIEHSLINGVFNSFHISPKLMLEKIALLNIEPDEHNTLEHLLIKVLHFGLFTKSGNLIQHNREFIYKTLLGVIKLDPEGITSLFNGFFQVLLESMSIVEIDDDYVIYYGDGVCSRKVLREYMKTPVKSGEVRYPNVFPMSIVIKALANERKVPFISKRPYTFLEYLEISVNRGDRIKVSSQEVMDLWKTRDTSSGMQSLESMGEIRELLGDSYYERVDPDIAELLADTDPL